MLNGLYKIVSGKAPAEVAGPIGVAQMAGQVAEKGMLPLITFVAFLSINLALSTCCRCRLWTADILYCCFWKPAR